MSRIASVDAGQAIGTRMEPPGSGLRAVDRPKPATLSVFEWALNAEELLIDEARHTGEEEPELL